MYFPTMQRKGSIGSSRASGFLIESRSRKGSCADVISSTDHTRICYSCNDVIDVGLVIAEDLNWHSACFLCKSCQSTLSEYQRYKNDFYCLQCNPNAAETCVVCGEFLETVFILANDKKYHSGCFKCSQCGLPLGSKEHYTLNEDDHIICDKCYQTNKISLISNKRIVDILWGSIETRLLDGQLRITNVLEGNGVSVGDIIFAINNVPISKTKSVSVCKWDTVTLTVTRPSRSRAASSSSSPPSPPPPSTRSHKRRILRTLSHSPPARDADIVNNNTHSLIFTPGQIEIGSVIGRGFFGKVYEAKLLPTNERVCLKELLQLDDSSANSFIDEVAVLKNLDHVNVLAFKGIVSSPHKLSLLTEYADGGTLRKLIKNKEVTIPWCKRLRIASDVACGMSYLHSKEIIHRDLTSKNCLLRSDGTTVVADFGLIQLHPTSHYNTVFLSPPILPVRRRSDSVGAVFWRAPEMLFDKPYDAKVDIFSYGIVMCELIARIKADPDILPRDPVDWGLNEAAYRELVPSDCPKPFLSVVIQCCCVNPELRPPFAKITDFLNLFLESSGDASQYEEALISILRTLHSITEIDD